MPTKNTQSDQQTSQTNNNSQDTDFENVDMWGVELFGLILSYSIGIISSQAEKERRSPSEEIYRWHKCH